MNRPRFLSPLGLYAALLYAFLHVPLLILIAFSFNESRFSVWQGFSFHWYSAMLHDPALAEATGHSIVVAVTSAVFATAIGTAAAYGMWKRKAPVLEGSLYLTLITPEIVTGISLLALFQWLFRWLPFRLGLVTVVIAHVAFSVAYVTVVVSARLRGMDRSLEEAALDLGGSEWDAFRRVTLPLLVPAMGAAALLSLVVSFDDYVITSMVAGVDSETLPMVIYAMARRGVNPVLNAVSSVTVVLFGTLILLSEKVRAK